MVEQQNRPPSIVVSPFEDPDHEDYINDMSSLPNNLERPKIGHERNSKSLPHSNVMNGQLTKVGSFRTRALAVAAAHRMTHSPEQAPRSPLDVPQGHSHGFGNDPLEEDIEAEAGAGTSPVSRTSHLFSPGGTKPKYRWLSATGGGGTGDEPGVDVRSRRDEESYGHLDGRTQISVRQLL